MHWLGTRRLNAALGVAVAASFGCCHRPSTRASGSADQTRTPPSTASATPIGSPSVQYGRTVVVPANASAQLKDSVADFLQTLQSMTGAEFTTRASPDERGILLAYSSSKEVPSDLSKRLQGHGDEAFILHSTDGERLWIVANAEPGLVDGLYAYLRVLGARWLLPGENWTIIPPRPDIRLTIDQLDEPAFESRRFFGTGGFGKDPLLPAGGMQRLWDAWERRNSFGGSYALAGHTGEAFNQTHRAVLEAHPEYLALVGGKRSPWSPGAKLCVSNRDAVKLYVDDRLAELRRGPRYAISVEPGDGGAFCECDRCRAIGSGSKSDQVFYLANQVAKAVAKEFPGTYVSLYAYSDHAALPTFPLEPNVYVVVIPDAWQRTGLAADDLLRAWRQRQKGPLGVYTYWALPDWTNDQPSFDWRSTPVERIRFWHSLGLKSAGIETSYSAGAMGLGLYLSSRLLWNPAVDDKALTDEFFRLAFGAAAAPMRRVFERWTGGLKEIYLPLAFRDLVEARTLATAPEARKRIKDVEEYVEFLKLWDDYQNTAVGSPERRARTRSVVRWLYRIEGTAMVSSYRVQQLLVDRYERDPVLRAEFNPADGHAAGWQGATPPTDAEVLALMTEAQATSHPLDIQERGYSSKLVVLRAEQRAAPAAPGALWLVGSTDVEFEVPPGRTSLAFDIVVKVGAHSAGDVVSATSPDGAPIHNELIPSDGLHHQVSLPTRVPGRYRVHIEDQKALFLFTPPAGIPMALTAIVSPAPCPPLYFFVPKGQRSLAFFAPSDTPIQLRDADGRLVPTGTSRIVQVPVPEGQDGRVWSIGNIKSWVPLRMLNVPHSFALSPDAVLVPEDAPR